MRNRIIVTLKESTTYFVPDTEVLLSFQDDLDAEAFEAWWNQEGNDKFADWFSVNHNEGWIV